MTDAMSRLVRIAQRQQLAIEIEQTTGYVVVITTNKGRLVLTGADLGLNTSSAQRLSLDKAFARHFLSRSGLSVIDEKLIDLSQQAVPDRLHFNFPVIVKPNRSARGDGVSLVHSQEQLAPAVRQAARFDNLVLIQPYIRQREFRLVMLGDELLYAYKRVPQHVVGDGVSTVRECLRQYTSCRDRQSKTDPELIRLPAHLLKAGYSLDDVLDAGECLNLSAVSNLAKGGESTIIRTVAPDFVRLAGKAIQALGLNYAGIDLFAASLSSFDAHYRIIEVNANPGFAALSQNEALYQKVIERLAETLFVCV